MNEAWFRVDRGRPHPTSLLPAPRWRPGGFASVTTIGLAAFALGLVCNEPAEVAPTSEQDARSSAAKEGGPSPGARPVDGGARRKLVADSASPGDASPELEVAPSQGLGHPLAHLDDAALEKGLLEAPETLGSVAVGEPGLGFVLNAVKMPEHERWQIVEPYQSWGTQETVDFIAKAIHAVNDVHAHSPPLYVGDLGRRYGGYILPHQFHQTGRDVDLGFYYSSPKRWYWKAWHSNLDAARTWSLIKALVTLTDVEMIYCDRYVIRILLNHAKEIGEDREWLSRVFGWREETKSRPLVRHVDGHRTHLHVRFYNPVAQESGRRLYPLLRKHRLLRHPELLVKHRVGPSETLKSVAKLYKTSRRAVRRVNELTSDELTPGQTYLVPKRVKIKAPRERGPVEIPPRTLPPT